ncbi:MAG: helix-turn-helix domain containing protein [Dehalococcoidales bacterium]|nr:helix-turn-helix domain containing protein [Dehalococcoidales bacterium]
MAVTRDDRKKDIAEMRKQQILDAALPIFSRKGFAMTTTSEIAKAAGVAEGTIYNYFPNKRELFIAVIKNLIVTMHLMELINKLPEDETPFVFHNILQDRLKFAENDNVSHIMGLMSEIQRDPELKKLYAEQFIQPFFTKMEGSYSNMMASGKIRKMNPAIATRIIGGMIIGFIMLRTIEGNNSPLKNIPRDEVVNEIMNFVFKGIAAESSNKKEGSI